MNEYRRLTYLEALGVSSYRPRLVLPHAPDPVLCELPVMAEPLPANHSAAAADQPASREDKAAAPSAIGELLENVDGARGSAPVQTPARPASTETAIAPFTLSIWRASSLLVVDSRQSQMPLPTERLLHNILFSLGGELATARPAEEILSWPLVENAGDFGTAAHAREQLQAWLEAELVRAPVAHMLVLGETAATYLLPENTGYREQLWQWATLPGHSAQVLLAPSLAELLRQASLKASLWRSLQPLRV